MFVGRVRAVRLVCVCVLCVLFRVQQTTEKVSVVSRPLHRSPTFDEFVRDKNKGDSMKLTH